ncbi:MAG: glycosyltransferase family 39 protein [Candidatus Moranbacteria bacterium]|nr:glycosyltransferase family 39 protein [Candidatus Moranbacteria bacterium]
MKDLFIVKAVKNNAIIPLFVIAFFVHVFCSFIGWNNNLIDIHGFRQTQTAISVYYLIQEGFKINYITPVLGAPWSIPFEFPIYHWVVALIVVIFHFPVDQSGRFVSLLFFYSSLLTSYAFLRLFIKNRNKVLLILIFVLLNPIYLFWSRTFLMESTALFFGISYCYFSTKFFISKKKIFLVLAAFFGIFGILTKITTFSIFLILNGILFVVFYRTAFGDVCKSLNIKKIKVVSLIVYVIFLTPIVCGLSWTKFADVQKQTNPLARNFIDSKSLSVWNFGTINQKIDPKVWEGIFKNATLAYFPLGSIDFFGLFGIPSLLIILLLFSIIKNKYRKEIGISLALFLSGPLIFTNLYFVHNYYSYANSIFLSVAVGLACASLLESKIKYKNTISLVIIVFFGLSNLYSYGNTYYYSQKNGTSQYIIKLADFIRKNTNEDDVIMIFDMDWDPSLSYYSERRSIMVRGSFSEKQVDESLANLGGRKVSAIVKGVITPPAFGNKRYACDDPDFVDGGYSVCLVK